MLLLSPRMTLQWLERGLREVNQEQCKHIVRDVPESMSQLFCRLLQQSLALVLYTRLIVSLGVLGARAARAIYTCMVPSESESELLALTSVIFPEADLLDVDLPDIDFPDPLFEDGVPDLELALLDLELVFDASSSCSRLRV
jgi:hypothetical protein